MGFTEPNMSSIAGCTFLANCVCNDCLKDKERAGNNYEGKFSVPNGQNHNNDKNIVRSLGNIGASVKEGWLLVRADSKNKSKTFSKSKFKKYFAVVTRNAMVIKKASDTRPVRTINLAKSMIVFQNDSKVGNYIRVANPGYVLEVKPLTENSNAINSWMIALQSNQSNIDLTGKHSRSSSNISKSNPVASDSEDETWREEPRQRLFNGRRSESSLHEQNNVQRKVSSSSLDSATSFQPTRKRSTKREKHDERKYLEVIVQKLPQQSLGMRICGGVGGNPHKPEIYVHTIVPDGLADKNKFCVGDIIVHVNRRKFDDVTIEAASSILAKSSGLVAIGVNRKTNAVPGPVRAHTRKKSMQELDALPKPKEIEEENTNAPASEEVETFGFPMSDEEEENTKPTTTSPTSSPVQSSQPEPKSEMTKQTSTTSLSSSTAPVTEETEEMSPEKKARAEKLAKMKAARLRRKSSIVEEIESILAIIDNLDEDAW